MVQAWELERTNSLLPLDGLALVLGPPGVEVLDGGLVLGLARILAAEHLNGAAQTLQTWQAAGLDVVHFCLECVEVDVPGTLVEVGGRVLGGVGRVATAAH